MHFLFFFLWGVFLTKYPVHVSNPAVSRSGRGLQPDGVPDTFNFGWCPRVQMVSGKLPNACRLPCRIGYHRNGDTRSPKKWSPAFNGLCQLAGRLQQTIQSCKVASDTSVRPAVLSILQAAPCPAAVIVRLSRVRRPSILPCFRLPYRRLPNLFSRQAHGCPRSSICLSVAMPPASFTNESLQRRLSLV